MKNAARNDVDGLRLDQARSGRSEDAGPATLPPARKSTSSRRGPIGRSAPDRSAVQGANEHPLSIVEDGTPVWLGDALLGYRGRRKRREPTMASLRLRDLGRVFRDRYGGVLPTMMPAAKILSSPCTILRSCRPAPLARKPCPPTSSCGRLGCPTKRPNGWSPRFSISQGAGRPTRWPRLSV